MIRPININLNAAHPELPLLSTAETSKSQRKGLQK